MIQTLKSCSTIHDFVEGLLMTSRIGTVQRMKSD